MGIRKAKKKGHWLNIKFNIWEDRKVEEAAFDWDAFHP